MALLDIFDGDIIKTIRQRKEAEAKAMKAAGVTPAPSNDQAQPVQEPKPKEPTFEDLTPEQQNEYALSNFDAVKDYLLSKKKK